MSGQEDQPKCPVSPESRTKWSLFLWANNSQPTTAPVITSSPSDDQPKCPVDHNTRADWLNKVSVSTTTSTEAIEVGNSESCTSDKLDTNTITTNVNLPTEREISSIPRTSSNSNWIYPSEKQFFDAMTRKKWNPNAQDMKAVVPIHNIVNERTWNHILNWEESNREETEQKCGGIKLTSFKGNPNKLTPRAWFRTNILGLEKPFDRHDWVVDRCGTEIEYVIDFYSGNETNPNVFLDVRPKLNSWEGIKLRFGRAVGWK